MQSNLIVMPDPQQGGLGFPQSLSEKYQPKTIAEFVGLEKQRKLLSKFVANPYKSAWLFVGASGVGKTSMGIALANSIPAELRIIPSRQCDLAAVDNIGYRCQFVPNYKPMHEILVEEADQMTDAAQTAWLSMLDAIPDNTVFVFTCNSTERLQPRFLSRCRPLEFSSYGMAAGMAALLERVWGAEIVAAGGDLDTPKPNFARIVKESCNNIRDALMKLELELMAV